MTADRSVCFLPVYAGDVSGACSALFELGGMTVIHDPSGCNSTYNTHDENRWYDRDSLIFISGLTERDAILGNDDKLIRDVTEAARSLAPRFIALCNSPVPFLNGTDFPALARLIEREAGLPCFYVRTNGMHDYTVGASNALAAVAERFVRGGRTCPKTLNLLGVTPLDFGAPGEEASLRRFAEAAGYSVLSCWAMGDGLDALSRAGEAAVSLVVSSAGLGAAEVLYRRFGVPYAVGAPVGTFRKTLAAALSEAERTGRCLFPCRDARKEADGTICFVGEPVLMGSLAAAAGRPARVICPLESPEAPLAPTDLRIRGETALTEALAGAALVLADPMYAPVCPEAARLVSLAHPAFSGRHGWKQARDITTLDPAKMLDL